MKVQSNKNILIRGIFTLSSSTVGSACTCERKNKQEKEMLVEMGKERAGREGLDRSERGQRPEAALI